jgi:hypothetical protein
MFMGAWGAGNFENDDALDWLGELEETADLSLVEQAILAVLTSDNYVEAGEGCIALAAAEVMAALQDKPVENLPEEVTTWIQTHNVTSDPKLVTDALIVVEKIRNHKESELRELWAEAEELEPWHAVLDDLSSRLGQQL